MTTNKEIREGNLRRPEQYESVLTEEDLIKVSELIKTFNLLKESMIPSIDSFSHLYLYGNDQILSPFNCI